MDTLKNFDKKPNAFLMNGNFFVLILLSIILFAIGNCKLNYRVNSKIVNIENNKISLVVLDNNFKIIENNDCYLIINTAKIPLINISKKSNIIVGQLKNKQLGIHNGMFVYIDEEIRFFELFK